jgi:hypothetical protein
VNRAGTIVFKVAIFFWGGEGGWRHIS